MSTQYVSKYLDKQKLLDLLESKFGKQEFNIEVGNDNLASFSPRLDC